MKEPTALVPMEVFRPHWYAYDMTVDAYIEQENLYGAHNYGPFNVVLTKGEGIWVWDVEGKRYLDGLSGYSALNQGHRHPRIIKALIAQANRLTLMPRAFHTDQLGPFLERVCKLAEMDKALPMNSGAEAVETAIKLVRKWGYQNKNIPEDKAEIIVCANNFHGRTTTIVGFSSEKQYRTGFGPFTPGFKSIEFGNLKQLSAALSENTVAFLVEPIQGEGGIIVPPRGYLTEAKKLCKKHNALFVLDEVQSGLGRTGKLFAHQHEVDAKPDVMTLGKALGGGVYPVSVVLAREDVMKVFQPGDHGSTFGGNPLAAAVGMAALDVLIEEELAQNAGIVGQHLMECLKTITSPYIKEIRGKGLWIGIELHEEAGPAKLFCERLLKLGLLTKETRKYVIRLSPPLICTKKDVEWIAEKVQACLTVKESAV